MKNFLESFKQTILGGFWIVIVIILINFSGCGNTKSTETLVEMNQNKEESCEDLIPYNSYDEGTGHYAGFEWAERKEVSVCGGNSESFIEGCEDYVDQKNTYDQCLH